MMVQYDMSNASSSTMTGAMASCAFAASFVLALTTLNVTLSVLLILAVLSVLSLVILAIIMALVRRSRETEPIV